MRFPVLHSLAALSILLGILAIAAASFRAWKGREVFKDAALALLSASVVTGFTAVFIMQRSILTHTTITPYSKAES